MATDDVIVLNEGLEFKTSKSGKTRATIKVSAEPLIHDFDAKELGKAPAQAIAGWFRQRIGDISSAAAPATLKARTVAKKAFGLGKTWALKRYAGGRIGAMPPTGSMALFNDSGRLAKSITANASSDDSWRVNVAANRLSPDTADHGGTSAIAAIFAKLVSFVPEIGDASALTDVLPVRAAIQDSINILIQKGAATTAALELELVESLLEAAKAVGELVEAFAE